MPKVSVIVPFHNRLTWTREAVQSVLQQTYSDFELLLVDDGSEEDIRSLPEIRDARVKYLRQDHAGRAAARNMGVRAAQGKYVAFLDSDDAFLPDKLKTQVEVMECHPEIPFTHTSYMLWDAGEGTEKEVASGRFSGRVYPRILAYCPIATPTVMVRTQTLSRDPFLEQLSVAEDIVLWSKLAKGSVIIGIDRALSRVRVHREFTFRNNEIQLQAIQNIIDYAVATDRELGFFRKQQIFSTMHSYRYFTYRKQRKYRKALESAVRALWTCPLNPDLYLHAVQSLFPEYFFYIAKRVKRM
jgi:glycosyltransferase involved in cell wall biosynthesis